MQKYQKVSLIKIVENNIIYLIFLVIWCKKSTKEASEEGRLEDRA